MKKQTERLDEVALSFSRASKKELDEFLDDVARVVTGVVEKHIPDREKRNLARQEIADGMEAIGKKAD